MKLDVRVNLPHHGESPPLRGRGLKHAVPEEEGDETVSPPLRGRGLKRPLHPGGDPGPQSPPLRGRGLKLAHFNPI